MSTDAGGEEAGGVAGAGTATAVATAAATAEALEAELERERVARRLERFRSMADFAASTVSLLSMRERTGFW